MIDPYSLPDSGRIDSSLDQARGYGRSPDVLFDIDQFIDFDESVWTTSGLFGLPENGSKVVPPYCSHSSDQTGAECGGRPLTACKYSGEEELQSLTPISLTPASTHTQTVYPSIEESPRSWSSRSPTPAPPSPCPAKRKRPKTDDDDDDEHGKASGKPDHEPANCPTSPTTPEYHRKIEKKYRKKLATNLDRLRVSVPGLLAKDEGGDDDAEAELFGVGITRKCSKANIICKATEFIEHIKQQYLVTSARAAKAELEVARLRTEVEQLRHDKLQNLSPKVDVLEARIAATRLLASLDLL